MLGGEELGKTKLTLTVEQEVVARARTSVGAFYQRFPGKSELLVHLAFEEAERVGSAGLRVTSGSPLQAQAA